jgi:hypothetical protein
MSNSTPVGLASFHYGPVAGALIGLDAVEIESQKGTIGDRDRKIANLKQDIAELEQQNAAYQEQVLQAYQKIKGDEATVSKAKKAVAIALTLLDEQIGALDDAGSKPAGEGAD